MTDEVTPIPDQIITCYAVPGLGASNELFSQLKFPPWLRIQPVNWEPCHAKENLSHYTERLLPQVDLTRPHIYIGFSFGAAVAVELAKRTRPRLTVIVSGVAQRKEIPFYLRRIRALGVYNLAPLVVRLWTPLLRWGASLAFGTKDPHALDMLVRMIRNIDPTFYECGLKAFMNWDNNETPEPLLHIHGSRDRLLPTRYVKPEIIIPRAGHFIIYTHAEQISQVIRYALSLQKPENPGQPTHRPGQSKTLKKDQVS